MITLQDVQAARGRIRDRIYVSPCARSETLSRLTGTNAHLKLENLQMTGAYKERGALNKLLLMPAADRDRGLIAASAGNHAQAVAYHAGRLGVSATIVIVFGTRESSVPRYARIEPSSSAMFHTTKWTFAMSKL